MRYARLGHSNHSIPIYTAYSGKHQDYHVWLRKGLTRNQIEVKRQDAFSRLGRLDRWNAISRVRNLIGKQVQQTIIISGEDIALLPPEGLRQLHAVLKRKAGEIEIVAYVRDPVSFMTSALQERIKNGLRTGHPSPPDYRAKLEKFMREFGARNVILREYHPDKLLHGDVVEDFARIVGVPAPPKPVRDNASLSTEAVRVIYLLNQFVSAIGDTLALIEARSACIAHLRDILPGSFRLPDHLIAGLIDRDDVNWLHEVSGIDFRNAIPADTVTFDPTALESYLEQPEAATLDVLRAALQERTGMENPPTDTKFLVARYLLSFLPPAAQARFSI